MRLQHKIRARAATAKIQYLEMLFLARNFYIDNSVHRPRASTEFITGQGYIPYLKQLEKQNLTVADIGIGSGVIAVSCALECPNVEQVYGVDLYQEALRVAARNIETLEADSKVKLLQGDLFEPLMNIPVDVLLLNLPFASQQKISAIAHEMAPLDEPLSGIFGGQTGFELYERLFKQLAEYRYLNSVQGIWIFCAREHLAKLSWYHQQQFSRFKLQVVDDRFKEHFIHCLLHTDS
jgi:release factor glutamine methyltransferase